jgi:hypothetical protein
MSVRPSIHPSNVCVPFCTSVTCLYAFLYIRRMSVRLSVHMSDVCASPYMDVCAPFCTSVGCLCAFLYISCKQFPFLSLRFPCYITYQNIFNRVQIVSQNTDCHFTESAVCFPFSLCCSKCRANKKNFWKERLVHKFLQMLSCFVLSKTLVIIQSSDPVLGIIQANESYFSGTYFQQGTITCCLHYTCLI